MDAAKLLLPGFIEMPAFQRNRESYLDDDEYRKLQVILTANPNAGRVIRHSGGMRKLRFEDSHRGKGKRGGSRIIYYWWISGREFWLFTLYSKDDQADLSEQDQHMMRALLEREIRIKLSLH